MNAIFIKPANMIRSGMIILTILFLTLPSLAQKGWEKDLKVAWRYHELRQFANALTFFERSAARHPQADTYNAIGDCQMALHNYDKAVKAYAKSLKMGFHPIKGKIDLAQAFHRTGKHGQAIRLVKSLTPNQESEKKAIALLVAHCDSARSYQKMRTGSQITHLQGVNTPYSDFTPHQLKDGSIVFASSKIEATFKHISGASAEEYYDLFTAQLIKGRRWSKPVPYSADINTQDHEGAFCFNEKEDTLYFSHCTNNQRKNEFEQNTNRQKLYQCHKTTIGWSEPVHFTMNDSSSSFAHPYISDSLGVFLFASDMAGGYGGTDLYICFRRGALWSKPKNLGPSVNTEGNELYPHLSPKGILYFCSDGLPGMGGYDIFSAQLKKGKWVNVTNLKPPINSSYDEYSPFISDNNISGFFASNRPGGKGKEDIYQLRLSLGK